MSNRIWSSVVFVIIGLMSSLSSTNAWAQSPVIAVQPLSQTTAAGADVTLGVVASGTGQLHYQWKKDGVDLQGETNATLTLDDVDSADAGDYSVVVSDSLGSKASDSATLTVTGGNLDLPTITVQPLAQNVSAGANVTFSVSANGGAPLTFQWMKDGVNLAGETGATLTLTNVTSAQAGDYSVAVNNSAGAATSTVAKLTVNALSGPIIAVQPISQTVPSGANVTFVVAATGNGSLQYQWKKNGADLSGQTGATLTLNNVTGSDAGSFSASVTDGNGAVTTSDAATLTVAANATAPQIVLQPLSQTVNGGANVTLTVGATGSGTLQYQWKKNGVDLSGQTSSTLTLNAVTSADTGNYSVTVSNDAGSQTSSAATITVNGNSGGDVLKPTIVLQPLDQAVSAGGNATFAVNATGSGTLKFQWQKNGVDLSGQTGTTLTINNASTADAGNYSVVISNDAGTTASSNATLTVRTNDSGLVDLSFLSGSLSNVVSVALQNDGKAVVSGQVKDLLGVLQNVVSRLNADGSVDTNFIAKADGNIQDLEVQSDGKVVIAGDFQSVNGLLENHVARLNADGTVDASFQTGTGANGNVGNIALQSDGKVILSGSFSAFNGTSHDSIVRLNSDGSVDASFNAGGGLNGSISDVELQPDGKIVVSGSFTTIQGATANNVARLNADGSVDTSFNAGLGTSGSGNVSNIALQSDGKILAAGSFATFGGTAHQKLARLNADGSVDASFNSSLDSSSQVLSVEPEANGKILVGGQLTVSGGSGGKSVVELNSDGSVDTSFNLGGDAPQQASAIEVQSDGKILIGGQNGVVRLGQLVQSVFPKIAEILKNGNKLEISVQTDAGANYSLETTSDLSNPSWSNVANLSGDGSVKAFTDITTEGAMRFFRIHRQ